MPLVEQVVYVKEPTDLQCGQAVLAMLSGLPVQEIVRLVGTERETNLKQMFGCFNNLGIKYRPERVQVSEKSQLPKVCVLSLETPRCWHWSLYFDGIFYDPEHGVMDDFPECNRKYYWEIER